MGLRKRHAKKENPRVYNSGSFGIIDKTESISLIKNSEVSLPYSLNHQAGKPVRDAMLEAEYRKAQAIALTRQMHYR